MSYCVTKVIILFKSWAKIGEYIIILMLICIPFFQEVLSIFLCDLLYENGRNFLGIWYFQTRINPQNQSFSNE